MVMLYMLVKKMVEMEQAVEQTVKQEQGQCSLPI